MALGRRAGIALAVALVASTAGVATAGAQFGEENPVFRETFLPGTDTLTPYRGDLHSQTGYSDGTQTPEYAFQQTSSAEWLDFFAVTDHSDWLLFPFRADTDCIGTQAPSCYQSPLPERTEWEETGFQAQRFTDEDFLAVRGFEWSSQVEGHVNVYNTRVWTDAEQTGHFPMTGFYAWLAGQELDEQRFATFNHPGREPLKFDNFSYEPRLDPYIVGLEAFNRDDDYSETYLEALDRGWHVGAVGVKDAHEADERVDRTESHTVALMQEFSKPGLREAYVHHHTVATRGSDQDARLYVDNTLMGDALADPGDTVEVDLVVYDAGVVGATEIEKVELLGPDGFQRTLAIGDGEPCERIDPPERQWLECQATVDLTQMGTTDLGEKYVTARAYQDYEQDGSTDPTVMTSAVWIDAPTDSGGLPQP